MRAGWKTPFFVTLAVTLLIVGPLLMKREGGAAQSSPVDPAPSAAKLARQRKTLSQDELKKRVEELVHKANVADPRNREELVVYLARLMRSDPAHDLPWLAGSIQELDPYWRREISMEVGKAIGFSNAICLIRIAEPGALSEAEIDVFNGVFSALIKEDLPKALSAVEKHASVDLLDDLSIMDIGHVYVLRIEPVDFEVLLSRFSGDDRDKLKTGLARGLQQLVLDGASLKGLVERVGSINGVNQLELVVDALEMSGGYGQDWNDEFVYIFAADLDSSSRGRLMDLIGKAGEPSKITTILTDREGELTEADRIALISGWARRSPHKATVWSVEHLGEEVSRHAFRQWLEQDSLRAGQWVLAGDREVQRWRFEEVIAYCRRMGDEESVEEWSAHFHEQP